MERIDHTIIDQTERRDRQMMKQMKKGRGR